jgi:hypothetical protein
MLKSTYDPAAGSRQVAFADSVVDLSSTQSISGIKTFKNDFYIDESAGGGYGNMYFKGGGGQFRFTAGSSVDNSNYLESGNTAFTADLNLNITGHNGGVASANVLNLKFGVITSFGTLTFDANNAHTIGDTSHYASNLYATTTNYNSTASFTGSTAGTINLNQGSLGILATSNAATHSLTLGSTATGIAYYNTSDQTTNYERVRMAWSGGTSFSITSEAGGTGAVRNFGFVSGSVTYTLAQGGTSKHSLVGVIGSAANYIVGVSGTLNGTSQLAGGLQITPTINQSSTAGYTALLVNPTETATGSGTKLLADFQVGGTSKFNVDNAGNTTMTGALTITTAGNSFTANDTSTPSSTGGTGMLGGLTQNPTASGQRLGYFLFKSPILNSAGMMAYTTEAHSSGHAGTYLSFWTTPTATTSRLIALQLGSDQSVTTYGNVGPNANNSYNLGGTGTYWSNLYATTLNLNSTASLSGGTAGVITATASQVSINGGGNNTQLTLNGTGTSVSIQLNSTQSGFHNYQFYANGTGGGRFGVYDATSTNTTLAVYGGTNSAGAGSFVIVGSGAELGWASSTNAGAGSVDTYFIRSAAGKIGTNSQIALAASTTTAASLNIPSGTAPTSPSDGDAWYDGTHLYFRIGTSSFQLDQQAGGGSMVYPGAGIAVSTGTAWGTSLTAPSGTIVGTSDTQTLTNKRTTARVNTLTVSGSTYTPNGDTTDIAIISSPTAAFTVANPTGTPVDGDKLTIRIKSGATGYIASWGTIYKSSGVATLPASTLPASKTVTLGFQYDATAAAFVLLAFDAMGY